MKIILYFIILLFINESFSQSIKVNKEFENKLYFSIEYNYRSYGRNDHTGNGASIDFSRELNKWFSAGLNVGYWQDQKLFWDFIDPFSGNRFIYPERIQESKISPYAQFFPIKTKVIDFYLQTGIRIGYLKQVFYEGGFNTNFELESFIVELRDVGQKQIIIGYELGFGLRFKINKFSIMPNTLFSSDRDGNSFNSLNLKIGWNFN